MNYKYVIFDVHGGMGKHIAATAVLSNIKEAYPDSKIIVVAAWPRVFLNHPDCYRVYANGALQYFYDDYIKDKDFLFLKSEPYHHTDYIKKERHLIDVWTEQCGVNLVHTKPNLNLNIREQQFYSNKYNINKPTLIIQTNGGTNLPYAYSWTRDMHPSFVVNLLNILKQKYQILHIKNKEQPVYGDDIISVTVDDIRELFGVLKIPAKKLLIDSFAQHACRSEEHTSELQSH